jgi:hypothetical protein
VGEKSVAKSFRKGIVSRRYVKTDWLVKKEIYTFV